MAAENIAQMGRVAQLIRRILNKPEPVEVVGQRFYGGPGDGVNEDQAKLFPLGSDNQQNPTSGDSGNHAA